MDDVAPVFFSEGYRYASLLPCFLQDVEIELSDGACGGTEDLNTFIDAVSNMTLGNALRELTQNFFDGCTEQYGCNFLELDHPTIDGMQLTVGDSVYRGEERSGCIMHANGTTFGEILLVENHRTAKRMPFATDRTVASSPFFNYGSLTFTNYGVSLASKDLLLCYGVSSKRGRANQVGEHGEGFCRAVTRLLKNDIGVSVHCMISSEGEYNSENWTFFLDDRDRVKCRRTMRRVARDVAKLEV